MDNLYIGSNGMVACIDPRTGEEVWKTELETGGFLSSTSHSDVTVLEDGGYVYAGCCGHLFCLDARDGREVWHNSLKGFGYNDVAMCIHGKYVCAKSPEES